MLRNAQWLEKSEFHPHQTLHCLLIDDSAFDRLRIERSVKEIERPIRISAAETASEARVMLATVRFDLLLIDYRLPDGDGLALLTDDARQIGRNQETPAVLVSGDDDPDLREAAYEAGFQSFITKYHFTPERLALAIAAVLDSGPDPVEA